MKTLLNYPGSKRRIASWIIQRMPAHHSYLEPYFGCGAVLFAKRSAPIETVNDLDGEVVNFFRVIRDPESRERLLEWLDYTPYAREVYEDAFQRGPQDDVERAGYFAVKSMQGWGFRMNGNCGWKKDVNGRECAYAVRYWNDLPGSIAWMAARLKQVQIENRPALDLIQNFNHGNVLMYLDPPYVFSTRSGMKQYRFEMTDKDHVDLMETVVGSRAKIMISGYDCELYDFYLADWNKVQIAARAQNNKSRVETLWMNYDLDGAQMTLEI